MADSKKLSFSTLPILNIFFQKFHGLVLGLVGLIDAKGIDETQPIWRWGCPAYEQKQPKKTKNAFFACFWAYVGQPHDHIGWVTSMSFTSINPTNPRTNPWNFYEKILRISGAGKLPFFESAILIFFFFQKNNQFQLHQFSIFFHKNFMDWFFGW